MWKTFVDIVHIAFNLLVLGSFYFFIVGVLYCNFNFVTVHF